MKIFEFTFVCSFMGLSETLPVTSYFKMIDIWMLFTMTVPFLEVVLLTAKEVFKKSKPAHACLSKRVDMVKVKPAEDDQEVAEEVKTGNNILNLVVSLMLPVSSAAFALIFWTVGLVVSYSDVRDTYVNMTECLAVQPK